MSNRSDRDLIGDIQAAGQRILDYVAGMSYADFMSDTKTQDAVVRNLEIIGEAVKHISSPLKAEVSQPPWKEWAKVRDKLIHHYFGVNLDIVWGVIQDSLPELLKQAKGLKK